MKIRTALVVFAVAIFVTPAIACGPMGGSTGGTTMTNNTGGRQMSQGRDQWSKKRIKHLRRQMDDYKKAQRTADGLGYATGEYVPQMHRNPAEQRQYYINRYEFLALKAERGKATQKDIAEMRALQHYLLGR
jgi:Ni/Co efflux regulator RcnB